MHTPHDGILCKVEQRLGSVGEDCLIWGADYIDPESNDLYALGYGLIRDEMSAFIGMPQDEMYVRKSGSGLASSMYLIAYAAKPRGCKCRTRFRRKSE